MVGHMQQFLLGHQLGDDISVGAFPSFQFVVTHLGFFQINKTLTCIQHVRVKER